MDADLSISCCFTVPLVSRVCPSDVCRIWKSGASLRVDITLLGFENMTWIRGRRSYIFRGDGMCSRSLTQKVFLCCCFCKMVQVTHRLLVNRFICRAHGGEPWRWSRGRRAFQHIPRNRGRHVGVDAASWAGSCQKVDDSYRQHVLGHKGYCFWEARGIFFFLFLFFFFLSSTSWMVLKLFDKPRINFKGTWHGSKATVPSH